MTNFAVATYPVCPSHRGCSGGGSHADSGRQNICLFYLKPLELGLIKWNFFLERLLGEKRNTAITMDNWGLDFCENTGLSKAVRFRVARKHFICHENMWFKCSASKVDGLECRRRDRSTWKWLLQRFRLRDVFRSDPQTYCCFFVNDLTYIVTWYAIGQTTTKTTCPIQ